jgi:hypothetical protein
MLKSRKDINCRQILFTRFRPLAYSRDSHLFIFSLKNISGGILCQNQLDNKYSLNSLIIIMTFLQMNGFNLYLLIGGENKDRKLEEF